MWHDTHELNATRNPIEAQMKMMPWLIPMGLACMDLNAIAQTQPNDMAQHCTRGTNPYQDLKDELNLVVSDLQDAGHAVAAGDAKQEKRLGRRIQKNWERFTDGAKKAQREIPAGLDGDLRIAAKTAVKGTKQNPEDLRALAKRVDDLSMTMTCPQ